jgi:molybdopterin-guanine dinucleotide biosynthesis protein A
VDAIVLAGGDGSRLGRVDKAALMVGSRTLLQRALDATAAATTTVVVGPRRETDRPVTWAREEPPGTGPVAAIAAGLAWTNAELVAVWAVDLPALHRGDVDTLTAAVGARDGAIFVDRYGRDQPLAGVYRARSLRAAIELLDATDGVPVHALIRDLDLARLVEERAADDCDTYEDLEAARARAEGS